MNCARGEVALSVCGQDYPLCLTLGALAELETAFQCQRLSDLQTRLLAMNGADYLIVLRALLRGGGHSDVNQLDLESVPPGLAALAIANAFKLGLAA